MGTHLYEYDRTIARNESSVSTRFQISAWRVFNQCRRQQKSFASYNFLLLERNLHSFIHLFISVLIASSIP
jgi:hypothetical protein